MPQGHAIALLSQLGAPNLGVFRGRDAVGQGVSRQQLAALRAAGALACALPDTYRITAVAPSEHRLRAALLWAGPSAAAARRSAASCYQLQGVGTTVPEIVLAHGHRLRSDQVIVLEATDRAALMVRRHRGILATGVEAT